MYISEDHWLSTARRCLSPNQNERPAGVPASLLVVHGISLPPGEFGGPYIDALFTNTLNPELHPYFQEIAGLTVSAHLLVRRDGTVVQYVPFDCRAWHAGRSCYDGRKTAMISLLALNSKEPTIFPTLNINMTHWRAYWIC